MADGQGEQLELFRALMTAIQRLEELGGRTDDLRETANRVADPYEGQSDA